MENDKIRSLTHREQAREKLPVFYGSRDNYLHGFKEVLNNAVDEVLNNLETGNVDVILHKDLETITISDTGRGMPLNEKDENGIPYYELIFTTLFASGKYEETNNNNSGINGLGTCVLNYSSEIFSVEVYNKNKKYIIEYENGGYIKTPLTEIEDTEKHGTTITFKLDKEIYTNTKYTYEEIKNIINKTAKVSSNITLSLTYEDKEIFHYDNLEDYFNTHSKDNIVEPLIGKNKLYEELDGEKTQVELVLSCSNDESLLQECMLNGNNLIEKSSIFEGIINGVKNFTHKYIKENNLYEKKEKPISNDDIENTITFCCNVLSNRVEFQSQTKFSTAKKLYKDVVQKYIQEILEIYSIEKKDDFIRLVNQILISKRAYEKAEKSRNDIKKKLQGEISITNKIEGLIDCKSKDKNERIICICEGKSALSAMLSGRQSIHALFPIRGKIMNCLKAPLDKILNSEIIVNLIKALGCGIEVKTNKKDLNNFNIENLKFCKIYIYVDADFDGIGSILPLLLTVFWKLTPTLVKQGRIFICETPKYEISIEDKYLYAIDDNELKIIQEQLKNKKYKIHYIKGLSELSAEAMAMCLSSDYKNITQITLEDIEQSIQMLELFMGDNIKPRREFILNEF